MRAKILLTGLLLLGLVSVAGAQSDLSRDLRDHPGFVDFRAMDISGGKEPKVEVNLKGSLLGLAARIASDEEPELASTLMNLEGIRVEVYDAENRKPDSYITQLAETARGLEQKGWETIVRVNDKGDQVYIAVKADGNNIVGLVVLAAEEDDEIVLVNIVGNINMDEIWRVGREFNIDHLDSVRHEQKKSKG
jgi:hypothetical protein